MLHIVERSYSPNGRMASHAHEWPSMSLVLRGAMAEQCGRRVEVARALSVSIMGADIEHDDRFGPNEVTLFSVHFADNWLDEDEQDVVAHWRWTVAGPVARSLIRLRGAVSRCASTREREQIVVDAVAAANCAGATRTSLAPPAWLARAREAIDDSSTWPSVAELAAIAGVHRVHLAHEFRRYFGVSVSAYTRRRALQRAAELMREQRATLARIAHEAGFHDHAHMCHAFQAEMGCSPAEARSLSMHAERNS